MHAPEDVAHNGRPERSPPALGMPLARPRSPAVALQDSVVVPGHLTLRRPEEAASGSRAATGEERASRNEFK
jgi:hypothetical protein